MKRTPLSVIALVAFAACGSDGGPTATDVWARASAPEQTQGAVYFQLTVPDDDTLVGAAVSADVAERAEVHEVVPADMVDDEMSGEMVGDEMSGGADDMSGEEGSLDMDDTGEMSGEMGAMVMREVADGLALTGGEAVSFEPGGYHVMLFGLADPLEVGEEFELTLDFASADDLTVTVEVSETSP